MTRKYKTNPMSRRNSKRFHVELPYEQEPAPNSDYWKDKLYAAQAEILRSDALVAIWESPLIPQNATYKVHAQLALRLVQIPSEIIHAKPKGD